MLEKLADGTAAEIFRARNGADQVLVELTRPALSDDIDMYGRFLDAARERQKLSHPGVIRRTLTGCQNDGRLFVVTEPIEGQHLGERLKRGTLNLKETARLGVSVCEALLYLHAQGIVHGNLRPSNIYLTGPAEAPIPKLLDMGLLLFRTTRSLKIPSSMVLVAPEYLSPERVRGQRADAMSDVYGMGVLLFEMISGHAPFVGNTRETTRQMHLSGPVPWVPPGLERLAPIIGLCLAKERSDRFQSVKAVREALLHVLAEADQPTPRVPPPAPLQPSAIPQGSLLPETATVLGSYELMEQIGQGGMGQVYLARHLTLDRKVAIKVLRRELATVDVHVTRFLQEARAVNLVRHPHIVEIHDFIDDRQAGNVWCVMEYLRGRSLKEVSKAGPLPIARVVRIARQVAQALGAAHHVGVVHRDVKPENIMLVDGELLGAGANDFVKVLDFGIAKLRDQAENMERPKTGHGEVIGTPAYMSPEQAQALHIDARSDVYSLGTVIYLLLAGRLPFDNNGLLQLAMQLVSQPPRPLPTIGCSGETLPSGLVELVSKCLEKSPTRRFQSMRELDVALARFEGQQVFDPTELDITDFDEREQTEAMLPPAPPVFAERGMTQVYEVERRRKPRGARWAFVVALILAGLAAWWVSTRGWPEESALPAERPVRAAQRVTPMQSAEAVSGPAVIEQTAPVLSAQPPAAAAAKKKSRVRGH